jgi:hypothetical protein
MKSKSFMEEAEEYCDLLIECAKNDEVSNEQMDELIDKKKRIIELYKKEQEKDSPVQK